MTASIFHRIHYPDGMWIKADLHNHTSFSFDGEMNPRRFVRRYSEQGFGAVAVTDHNTRLGALAVRDLDPPFKVIVGCEISTKYGELIGLFLDRDIRRGMTPVDAAKAIRDAGGLVLLPHPFTYLVLSSMQKHAFPDLLPHVDIIEGINARGINPHDDADAMLWAQVIGLAASGGSDAHTASAAGSGYVVMQDFDGPRDFLEKLRGGLVVNTRRETLFWSATNYTLGKIFGVRRIRKMAELHKQGRPLREIWDWPTFADRFRRD